MEIRRDYCRVCDRDVVVNVERSNHVLHLLLTCITFGLWFPVWFFRSFTKRNRCSQCGGKIYGGGRAVAGLDKLIWWAAGALVAFIVFAVVVGTIVDRLRQGGQ